MKYTPRIRRPESVSSFMIPSKQFILKIQKKLYYIKNLFYYIYIHFIKNVIHLDPRNVPVRTSFAFLSDDTGQTLALAGLRVTSDADGEVGVTVARLAASRSIVPESGSAALAVASGRTRSTATLAAVLVTLSA